MGLQGEETLRVDAGRLYYLIGALEMDLRDILDEYVFAYKDPDDALGDRATEILSRAQSDERFASGDGRLVDFLDTTDSWAVMNANRPMLPERVGAAIRQHTSRLDRFAPVRNRVMHHRPLHDGDPEAVTAVCGDLADERLGLARLEELVARLRENASYMPSLGIWEEPDGRVLHNLPQAEFDETGLLGRERESKQLVKLILDPRTPVVTVKGSGGIGKTALVVKVLYDLLDSPDCPFEAILWHSLKDEHLTGRGVQQMQGAASDMLGMARALAEPLEPSFDGSAETVGRLLAEIPTLIVIDNLETADASEFVALYDAMPAEATFLVTSRVGLGQLERVFDLGPLEPKAAALLLRRLAQRRGLTEIVTMSEGPAQRVVEGLRYTPLAIRWFIEAVEAGAEPEDALSHQNELLEFCMGEVYRSLSATARQLLPPLLESEVPLGRADLAVVTSFELDDLNAGLQELQRRGIIVRHLERGVELSSRYALSDSAHDFLRTIEPMPEEALVRAREKLSSLMASEERRRVDVSRRGLSPNVIDVVTDTQKSVATVLRQVLAASRRGDLEEADAKMSRAERLGPDYFEVPRVRAFLNSQSRPQIADTLYQKAYELAPAEYKPKVRYFQSWVVAHNLKDATRAKGYAQEAHDAIATPSTAIRLGEIHMFLMEFDEAADLLTWATEHATNQKTLLVARTVQTNLVKRRVEYLADEGRQPLEAVREGNTQFRAVSDWLAQGIIDRRLRETTLSLVSEVARTFAYLPHGVRDQGQGAALLGEFLSVLEERLGLFENLDTDWLEKWLQQLVERDDVAPEHKDALARIGNALGAGLALGERRAGVIDYYNRQQGFGFIRRADTGERLFFPGTNIHDKGDSMLLMCGTEVSFSIVETEKGLAATEVSVAADKEARDAILRGRTCEITDTERTFARGRDVDTGCSVLVYRAALSSPSDWRKVRPGTFVKFDLDAVKRDRPVKGSGVLAASAERSSGRHRQGDPGDRGDALERGA